MEAPLIEIRQPGRPLRRLLVDRALEIGRSADGIAVDDNGVSRRHLKLLPSPLGLSAVDLGSRNGTLLNGLPLAHRTIVQPGDVIRIGATDILLVRQHSAVAGSAIGGSASGGSASGGSANGASTSGWATPRPVLAPGAVPAPPPAAPRAPAPPGAFRSAAVWLFTGQRASATSPLARQASSSPPSQSSQASQTSPQRPMFRTFMEMPRRLPLPVWHAIRATSVLAYLALCVALFVWPGTAMVAFFKVLVPLLPLLFLVAPGLWRNICPLAAANQAARVFGFGLGRTLPGWLQRRSFLIAAGLFFGIAGARLALFNASAAATGILLALTIATAFVMGVTFRGKSGWCSSICPLFPLQRIYGQTPYVVVANTHCNPCVSCSHNCYDFRPQAAYQADLQESDPGWSRPRRLFAAALPGFVLGFYTLLTPSGLSGWQTYGRLALYMAASVGLYVLLASLLPRWEPLLVAVWGAAALCLFYWFGVDVLASGITSLTSIDATAIRWPVRIGVIALGVVWVSRTLFARGRYLAENPPTAGAATPAPPPPPAPVLLGMPGLPGQRSRRTGRRSDGTAADATAQVAALGAGSPAGGVPAATVRFDPDGDEVPADAGMSVLEVAERGGKVLEAGCRLGVCGADPIAILDGASCLTEASEEERKTLRRLGFAASTRMACCARLQSGTVTVNLTPEPGTADDVGARPAQFDRSIAGVVVLGNGIAAVTAADFVRRGHPDCEIHVVGSESEVLYNRMGISRLVYGRTAMAGLPLLAEGWYADHGITAWLNTIATGIDTKVRRVDLGTGESLYYDRLIIATGSASSIPPLPGFGAPGTFVMRTAGDAMRIRHYAQEHHARTAVVAGGGLLGLEAAFALHALGLQVTVLERGRRLMSRQLDERASALVDGHFRRLGITVLYQAESAALQVPDGARAVMLKDGRAVPCDVFLAAVGIRPNADLAGRAGIACNRGILVDDRMQTSMPGVFAAGDVAEHAGTILGLWPIAAEQGEIAAVNALGGDRRIVAEVPATILKGVDLELASFGQVEPGPGDEVIAVEGLGSYRRLVISRGAVVGAIVLGHHPQDQSAAIDAVRQHQRLDAWALAELRAGRWEVLRTPGRVLAGAPV